MVWSLIKMWISIYQPTNKRLQCWSTIFNDFYCQKMFVKCPLDDGRHPPAPPLESVGMLLVNYWRQCLLYNTDMGPCHPCPLHINIQRIDVACHLNTII